jgi:hypothetical protein
MAKVVNRADRRAAEAGETKVTVRVTNRIAVGPMEHVETCCAHKIASEGQWGSGRELIVIHSREDPGPADDLWFGRTLEKMRKTRRRKGTVPIRIGRGEGRDVEIDVGLVDVTVFFEMPPGIPPSLPTTREEIDMTFAEYARHFDSLCAGAIHDQMILASVPHFFISTDRCFSTTTT